MDFQRLMQQYATASHVAMYRMTNGFIGHRMFDTEAVLLTTRGRKSGRERVTPLTITPDGDRIILIASNGGAPRHPDWYLNLQANPDVDVQRGAARLKMRARTAGPEERPALWAKALATYRGYDDYQRRAPREIPVVVLDPA